MSSKADLTPEHIMQAGLGFWASKVLLSAVEMGVFTELANGPEEFSELAGRLGCMPVQPAIIWMRWLRWDF